MIARVWKGWTKKENADAYEALLRDKMYPEMRKTIKGYKGGYILRKDEKNESEFVTVNFFDSLDTVKAFAGENYTTPVFEPEALELLSKKEPLAYHYEVKESPVKFE